MKSGREKPVGVNEIEHRSRPCLRCPWRSDCDLKAFTDADFDMLASADGRPGCEAPLDAPMIACHLDRPDTAHPKRLCAGWLAVVGPDHLAVRFHVLAGRLPVHALAPGADLPTLHTNLVELLAHRPT
jgi:hypothetical protein